MFEIASRAVARQEFVQLFGDPGNNKKAQERCQNYSEHNYKRFMPLLQKSFETWQRDFSRK